MSKSIEGTEKRVKPFKKTQSKKISDMTFCFSLDKWNTFSENEFLVKVTEDRTVINTKDTDTSVFEFSSQS